MTDCLTSVLLGNGIIVNFIDRSNRYYGDFHRVKIDIIAKFPVNVEQLPEELHALAAASGGMATYERSLEKMGVPSADLENVAKTLIDNFIGTVGCYLEKETFVESLLYKKLDEEN